MERYACTLFVVILITALARSLSVGFNPPSRVNKPLNIPRGGSVDVRNSFTVDDAVQNATECKIQYIFKPKLSCGEVSPSIIPCDYKGSLMYQHYGCLINSELITFELFWSSQDNSSSQTDALNGGDIHIFSIELLITKSNTFNNVQLVKLQGTTVDHQSRNYTSPLLYRLRFPSNLLGKCHYEVLNNFPQLQLPMHGELEFTPKVILPCGYVNTELQYTPIDFHKQSKDFILIRIYSYTDQRTESYFSVIALDITPSIPENIGMPTSVPTTLTIQQAINTPVAFHYFTDSVGIYPVKYLVEVHPQVGSFRTALSAETNVSHTSFTRDELLSGYVSFYPRYNSPKYSPILFRYTAVFDCIGSVSIDSELTVVSQDIIFGNNAAQRTNNPLKVTKNGISVIDSQTIEFYLLGECVSQAVMQLLVPPQHGQILFLNGSQPTPSMKFPVEAVSNGRILSYKHSGDMAKFDQMIWEIRCISATVLNTSMRVLIAQDDDISPVSSPTVMLAYRAWSQPLSPSNFKIFDPDSSIDQSAISIIQINGSLIRATHTQEFYQSSQVFPFIKIDEPLPHKVMQFTLSDVHQQLIWYVPPENSLYDIIKFELRDTSGNQESRSFVINVTISEYNINETVLIGTNQDIHTVAVNMSIVSTQPVYITSHYLYSVLPQLLDEPIVYMPTKKLENGTLCVFSCLTSIESFTQKDINQQRIVFSPFQNFTYEIITFEIAVNSFRSHSPNLVTMEIRLQKESITTKENVKSFWVRRGKEKRIRPFHFPSYPSQTRFVIKQGTEYGLLLYRNGTDINLLDFTFDDLEARQIWYQHNSGTSCFDSFRYDVILENETISSIFPILIRQNLNRLAINVTNKNYRISETNRFVIKQESFHVVSSFCPQFVVFNIIAPPQFGALSLIDTKHSLVVQLDSNDKFTLKDIQTGLLRYTLFESHSAHISDQIIFNASDPRYVWPSMLERQEPTVGRFVLYIDTSETIKKLDLKITTPRLISWLPNSYFYGAVLGQNDINISNSSVDPSHVNLQVEDATIFYEIQKNFDDVAVFTLAEIYSGQITFAKTRFWATSFQDTVRFLVNVEVNIISRNETISAPAQTHSLTFVWAFIEIDIQSRSFSEKGGSISFIIRRKGHKNLWFESKILFSTISGSAIGTNCSNSSFSGFDFCDTTQILIFRPNVTVLEVTVILLDDNTAELDESFSIVLSHPENAVVGDGTSDQSITTIIIQDNSDYADVKIEADIAPSTLPCDVQLANVQENVNILSVNLTRSGSINDKVGVLCKTEAITAQEGFDYEGRNEIIWFQANETNAHCNVRIIDDLLHEPSELFRVILQVVDNGKANIVDDYSQLCVFIRADVNDEPAVSFEKTEIVVRESSTNIIQEHFNIQRTGSDLRNRTVLQFRVDGGNATYGVDYIIFTGSNRNNPNCKLSGPGIGCVVFNYDEAPLETVWFQILNDSIYEGNETFNLIIVNFPHMAHVGYPNRLTVTIMDSSAPPVVGFQFPYLIVNESIGWSNVPVIRSGNLQDTLVLTCSYNKITADLCNSESQLPCDVTVATGPEQIIFRPGQSMSFCPFLINDDSEYEREETFEVFLKTSNSWVILLDNVSSTVVSIHDFEDVPTVQFNATSITASEPLSNYVIDSETVSLTLTRMGDINQLVAVRYSLVDGIIDEKSDYYGQVHGIITFLEGEHTKELPIQLKANRSSHEDTFLTVLLSEISEDQPKIVQIGENRSLTIHIKNQRVREPLLPGIPLIANRGSHSRDLVHHQYPLHCVTPCSARYRVLANQWDQNDQILAECVNIDLTKSIFMWEYSLDNHKFHLLNTNTTLSLVNSEFLDPVYLQPQMYVRCSCIPVDRDGGQGHHRTSEVVSLADDQSCIMNDMNIAMELSSYGSFAGNSQDLIKITFQLPHVPNNLPVVLMNNPTKEEVEAILLKSFNGICSSVDNFKVSSQQNEWYSSLNHSDCNWKLDVWLPLKHIQQECQGNLTFSNSLITLQLHVVYFHVGVNQTIEGSEVYSLISDLSYLPASQCLPPPIHYHPKLYNTIMMGSYVYPIAADDSSNSVYFYSVNSFANTFIDLSSSQPVNQTNQNLTLLYINASQRVYVWKLTSEARISVFSIILVQRCRSQSLNCTIKSSLPYVFTLNFDDETCFPQLEFDTHVHLKGNSSSINSSFTIGDVLTVDIKLAAHQEVLSGYSINPKSITLSIIGSLTTIVEIWKVGSDGEETSLPSAHLQFATPKEEGVIQFSVTTNFIVPESIPSNSILTITWVLANGSYELVQRTKNIPLVFTTPQITPVSNHPDNLTAAAVGIFVATFLIAAVTSSIVVILVCAFRGQSGWNKRVINAKQELPRKQLHIAKRVCGPLSGRTKVTRKRMVQVSSLRRTHSTTGFPATAEHYKRRKNDVSIPSHQNSISRCRSLPNLCDSQINGLQIEPFLLEPRRNLNQVHTRVKMLNSFHAKAPKSSDIARKRLLKACKVENFKSKPSAAPKQTNCNVIQEKSKTQNRGSRNEYASFAVRSIAASAKSPEPGSSPSTAL